MYNINQISNALYIYITVDKEILHHPKYQGKMMKMELSSAQLVRSTRFLNSATVSSRIVIYGGFLK